jgi:hypothetical protein
MLSSPRLDSNNGLLYGIPKAQITRLQRIQNSAVRIVTKCNKSEHITPFLKQLHWLPIQQRIKFKILIMTYKCLHGLAPVYLSDLLTPDVPPRALRSSSAMQLAVPKTELSGYGDRAFAKCSPVLWNALPIDIKSCTSLNSFKAALKTHLFSEHFKVQC